jgi:hypothetical protein
MTALSILPNLIYMQMFPFNLYNMYFERYSLNEAKPLFQLEAEYETGLKEILNYSHPFFSPFTSPYYFQSLLQISKHRILKENSTRDPLEIIEEILKADLIHYNKGVSEGWKKGSKILKIKFTSNVLDSFLFYKGAIKSKTVRVIGIQIEN